MQAASNFLPENDHETNTFLLEHKSNPNSRQHSELTWPTLMKLYKDTTRTQGSLVTDIKPGEENFLMEKLKQERYHLRANKILEQAWLITQELNLNTNSSRRKYEPNVNEINELFDLVERK